MKESKDANKEEELLKSYKEKEVEEYEIIDEYEIADDEDTDNKKENNITKKKSSLFLNILFTVIIILICIISIDVLAVKKFNSGPFFAIPIKTYDDGGSKEYYGLGYKVIKYNQTKGRKGTVIGTWGLKYNDGVIKTEAIDLAIEFTDDVANAQKKYQNEFIEVSGVLTSVSMNENSITISYSDPDEKYSLDIVCMMSSEKEVLETYDIQIRITARGTVDRFEYKTPDKPATLYLKDCFAEQDL